MTREQRAAVRQREKERLAPRQRQEDHDLLFYYTCQAFERAGGLLTEHVTSKLERMLHDYDAGPLMGGAARACVEAWGRRMNLALLQEQKQAGARSVYLAALRAHGAWLARAIEEGIDVVP